VRATAVTTVFLLAAALFGWGALSARLERADLTAPIVFVAVGFALSRWAPLDAHLEAEALKVLTEVTLVWVLFSDAAQVGLRELRADAAVYVRLLAVALPVTVVLGWALAAGVVGGLSVWLALFVGAALAPTDAALGAAIMGDRRVPSRVRRIVNVESGLNDGIVTPVVLLAIAGAAAAEHGGGVGHAVLELLVGVLAGAAVGAAGGWLLRVARRHDWVDEAFGGPAVLALAVAAYAGALVVGGNGFVAAFVAGTAFGAAAGPGRPQGVHYVEQTAGLAGLLVWTFVGAVAVPRLVDAPAWRLALYAVLSLTVVRMLPVAVALLGSGLQRRAALFIGWFGPRGLASVVFALLALEELGPDADRAVAVVVATVLLSVVAHGLSAAPLAGRVGPTLQGPPSPEAQAPPPPGREGHELPTPRGGS
jgi:NhaP-type Na+/H+ or K+/H+ antiporter